MGKTLYLGTDPSRYPRQKGVIHLPLIQIKPLPIPPEIQSEFDNFTHVIVTSPNAARILIHYRPLHQKHFLAIGKGTAAVLQSQGWTVQGMAQPESQEGMIRLLQELPLQKESYLFYPRSSRARPLLANYLQERGLKHRICDLYETIFLKPDPIPSLEDIEEIVFTSPSTVHAFMEIYKTFPKDKTLTCIGPITKQALEIVLNSSVLG